MTMQETTVLFTKKLNESDRKKIEESLNGTNKINLIFPESYEEDDLLKYVPRADVIVGLTISKKLLDVAAKLKLFQVPAAGVSKLDLSLFDRSITVCNSHSNASTVAEHACALLLSLIKEIPRNDKLMRRDSTTLPPETLQGKVTGIIGYGHIGKKVAQLLKPFGTQIIVLKREPSSNQEIDPNVECTTDVNRILKESDYIVITIPLTKETQNMIRSEQLKQMKRSVRIVNVARAEIIEQRALYDALKEKIIHAAAIDVWYDKIIFPFNQLDNLIMSPYKAAYAPSAPHLDDVIENIKRFASNRKLINIINMERGY